MDLQDLQMLELLSMRRKLKAGFYSWPKWFGLVDDCWKEAKVVTTVTVRRTNEAAPLLTCVCPRQFFLLARGKLTPPAVR